MRYIKGFVGLFVFFCGVGMMFFPETRGLGGFAIGFGLSLAGFGFSEKPKADNGKDMSPMRKKVRQLRK